MASHVTAKQPHDNSLWSRAKAHISANTTVTPDRGSARKIVWSDIWRWLNKSSAITSWIQRNLGQLIGFRGVDCWVDYDVDVQYSPAIDNDIKWVWVRIDWPSWEPLVWFVTGTKYRELGRFANGLEHIFYTYNLFWIKLTDNTSHHT